MPQDGWEKLGEALSACSCLEKLKLDLRCSEDSSSFCLPILDIKNLNKLEILSLWNLSLEGVLLKILGIVRHHINKVCSGPLLSECNCLAFNMYDLMKIPSEESDSIYALVKARQGLELPDVIETEEQTNAAAMKVLSQNPSDLCSLLIKSNCYCWKEYIRRVSDSNTPRLYSQW